MKIFNEAKECASCEFWTGKRTTDLGREQANVEFGEKGKCIHESGGLVGPWEYVGTSVHHCPNWKKWGVLKG